MESAFYSATHLLAAQALDARVDGHLCVQGECTQSISASLPMRDGEF